MSGAEDEEVVVTPEAASAVLVRECQTNLPMHTTAQLLCPPGGVNFAPLRFVPIPWGELLTCSESRFLFKTCCPPCRYPLIVSGMKHPYYSTGVSFLLHCHCSQPLSLRCLSMASFLKHRLVEYLQGCYFNNSLHWYRTVVNWHGPTHRIMYVGSVMRPDMHHIYVQLCYGSMGWNLLRTNFGSLSKLPFEVFREDLRATVVVFFCSFCPAVGAGDGETCARRLRKTLRLMYQCLYFRSLLDSVRNNHWGGYRQPSCHRQHERALFNYHAHGSPIPYQMCCEPYSLRVNTTSFDRVLINAERS